MALLPHHQDRNMLANLLRRAQFEPAAEPVPDRGSHELGPILACWDELSTCACLHGTPLWKSKQN